MIDAVAAGAAADSPPHPPSVSARLDDNDAPWPLRPWIMAAICAVAGLVFHMLIDRDYGAEPAPLLDALAAFTAIATVVFVLGVEQRRWHWALGFAVLWGAVMGLITWHASGYNFGGSPVEWPFWSGILAVLVATPLFQTRRDVAPDWRFWKLWQMPYPRLHSHAWTDAVIGAASLAFVGITFLLTVLIGQMFKLIGINLIFDLLNDEWFGWMLAGAAFGGAVGLLRERDRLVATLQRLVMIVLAVLAPVLAVALVLFLLSLAGTGLQKLWDSGFSTAGVMMGAAAFAVLLANAVIGNGGDERATNPALRWAPPVLGVAVLPLATIAFYSMHLRVLQYGWTPERIWGVIAAMIALAYGLAGLWAVAKGRRDFDDVLRPLQQKLAIGLALLALFLALPILDFGAISTRDQVARLKSGAVKIDKFDWAAMAFDFGPTGREALKRLETGKDAAQAKAARTALEATDRWSLHREGGLEPMRPIEQMARIVPADAEVVPALADAIRSQGQCRREKCAILFIDDAHVAILEENDGNRFEYVRHLHRDPSGRWVDRSDPTPHLARTERELDTAKIDVREVQKRQIFVNGEPLGGVFE